MSLCCVENMFDGHQPTLLDAPGLRALVGEVNVSLRPIRCGTLRGTCTVEDWLDFAAIHSGVTVFGFVSDAVVWVSNVMWSESALPGSRL